MIHIPYCAAHREARGAAFLTVRKGGARSAILALVLLFMSAPVLAQHDQIAKTGKDATLAVLVDENGRIQLPAGFSGPIDPSGYEMLLSSNGAPRFVKSGGPSNQSWSQGEFGFAGCDGGVSAMAAIAGELFVGGSFEACGLTVANSIARFDPATNRFAALGEGINGGVLALVPVGSDLYVGGSFSVAGGLPASGIAVYDAAQSGNAGWSSLGDGVVGSVYALDAIGTDLFVGGSFGSVGDNQPVGHIAKFDTTQEGNSGWSPLGSGANDFVRALAAIGTDLYIGGRFSGAGMVVASNIAKFDTTKAGDAGWTALGDGVSGPTFSQIEVLAAVGTELYVGGSFAEAGGLPASGIARFDTTQAGNTGWSEMGDGVDGLVQSLATIGTNLYVGGFFTSAGAGEASNVAVFDTSQAGNAAWSTLGEGVDNGVSTLAAVEGELYLGGNFTAAGGVAVDNLSVFDATQIGIADWSAIGRGVDATGPNGRVHAMAAIGSDLYIGGLFDLAGGRVANNIAVYDTRASGNSAWSTLGDGVNGSVLALATIGSELYVGGLFNEAGGMSARGIAKYDTRVADNQAWSDLGDGVTGRVGALAFIGTDLYVGGYFIEAGGQPAFNIARFDTSVAGNQGWSSLGDGVGDSIRREVHALTAIGLDLYVGGRFSQAGAISALDIARFDTSRTGNDGWSSLGDGLFGNGVSDLQVIDSDLYVGGRFTEAGSVMVRGLAKFDTTQSGNAGWSTVGDASVSRVAALAASGSDLYVGGSFSSVVGLFASNVAVFDTSQIDSSGWSALGAGVDGSGSIPVSALEVIGAELHFGGDFILAGGKVNRNLATYDTNSLFSDSFEESLFR